MRQKMCDYKIKYKVILWSEQCSVTKNVSCVHTNAYIDVDFITGQGLNNKVLLKNFKNKRRQGFSQVF
jgi:hypothetical protein